MPEYSMSSTMIPSYNGLVVVELDHLTTASDQYWADRKAGCEETITCLTQVSVKNDPDASWDEFCARGTGFLDTLLARGTKSLSGRLRKLWGWNFSLIKETQEAFLRGARAELWIPISDSLSELVRFPGRGTSYEIVDYPNFEGQISTPNPIDNPISAAFLDGQEKFTEIRLPVLAIFNVPHSPIFRRTMEDQANAFAVEVPQAHIVRIENADHYLFQNKQADVVHEIDEFVASLPTRISDI